jgi:O-antigen ligase
MATAVVRRDWLTLPLLALGAVLVGALVGRAPTRGRGRAALCVTFVLAFRAPVVHLAILILLTAVVPFTVQNAASGGGGASLFPSDLLLATGLLRSTVVLLQRPLGRARLAAAGLTAVFLIGVLVQLVHGQQLGADVSQAGGEARALLGFGTVLIALPILDDAAGRARVAKALLVVGLLLGAWGIAQWTLNIAFGGTGDVGVREGINYTTAGRGQVQGGLYGFPIAILLGFAFLVSGPRLRLSQRLGILTVVILNSVSLLLTYERTFWVATAVGIAAIIVRAEGLRRLKAAAWTVLTAAVALAVVSAVSPSVSNAARERLLSLGQYSNDDSLRYRIVESRHVVAQIDSRPVVGSGLAAQIFWGRPWEDVPERFYYYNHNGYLALAWKLGIPLAVLLLGLIAWSIAGRAPPVDDAVKRALTSGAQAGLLALAIVSVTFPSYTTLAITATTGLLMAISFTAKDGQRHRCSTPMG